MRQTLNGSEHVVCEIMCYLVFKNPGASNPEKKDLAPH